MIISSRNGFSVFLKYTKWAAAAPNCGYSLLVRKCKFSWKVSYRPNALCLKAALKLALSVTVVLTPQLCAFTLLGHVMPCSSWTSCCACCSHPLYIQTRLMCMCACISESEHMCACVCVCVQDVCIMNHRLLPIGATCLQLTSCIDLWNKVNVCDLFWQLLAAPFKKTGLSCDHKEHEFHFFLKRSWGSAIVSTDTKHMHCVFYCQRQARDTHADTHRLVL